MPEPVPYPESGLAPLNPLKEAFPSLEIKVNDVA